MAYIQLENIQKSFAERRQQSRLEPKPDIGFGRDIPVLYGIDLVVEQGELVTILGPSGCGKSTLLRLVAGFDQDYSGRIVVGGQQVTGPGADSIFVFQDNGLLPWLTVEQNVELGVRYKGAAEKKNMIQEYLDLVELDEFAGYYPHQLSGGMQRRAELARALVVSPALLIMDEPFSGLDFLTHMKMREEVVNMHQFFNQTILMVTHNIDDALIMGDRVVVLGNRPATVKLDHKLDFGHPRDPKIQSGLQELRDEIFFMLGVNYAI